MMGDGTHVTDTLRWMCGGEVVDIEGSTKWIGVPDINFFAATIRLNNGATELIKTMSERGQRSRKPFSGAPV